MGLAIVLLAAATAAMVISEGNTRTTLAAGLRLGAVAAVFLAFALLAAAAVGRRLPLWPGAGCLSQEAEGTGSCLSPAPRPRAAPPPPPEAP